MFERLKRLSRIGRQPYDYDEVPSQDSWNASHHEYLDNLGAPMLSSLLAPPPPSSFRQREWLLIDEEGQCSSVLVDKHELVLQLGVHYRDLRIVDPHVPTPYPSGIFLREKAMVLNLESLRCIICKDRVYILSVPTPGKPLNCGTALSADNFFIKDLVARVRPTQANTSVQMTSIDRQLPFELRALESALAAAVRTLEIEAMFLEKQTLPALTRLMQQVSRKELNTIRHSKTSVTKLLGRVTSIKKELEDLLDDDEDMLSMYLARKEMQKLAQEQAAKASQADQKRIEEEEENEEGTSTEEEGGDLFPISPDTSKKAKTPFSGQVAQARPIKVPGVETEGEDGALLGTAETAPEEVVPPPSSLDRHISMAASAPATEMPSIEKKPKLRRKSSLGWRDLHDFSLMVNTLRRMAPKNSQGQPGSLTDLLDPSDFSGCESLLEAYFLQVDYLMSRLTSLEGRIGNTEDQLNIEMDHRRNELQALDLAITAFMSSLAFISMIGGIVGMNMKNGFEESKAAFYMTTGITISIAIIILLGIVRYAQKKKLLFIIPGNAF